MSRATCDGIRVVRRHAARASVDVPGRRRPRGAGAGQRRRLERVPAHLRRAGRLPGVRRGWQRRSATKGFVTGVTLISSTALPPEVEGQRALVSAGQDRSPTSKLLRHGAGHDPDARRSTSGKKYTYRVNLSDGTSFTVTFGVR